jgi:hypothetical protein
MTTRKAGTKADSPEGNDRKNASAKTTAADSPRE